MNAKIRFEVLRHSLEERVGVRSRLAQKSRAWVRREIELLLDVLRGQLRIGQEDVALVHGDVSLERIARRRSEEAHRAAVANRRREHAGELGAVVSLEVLHLEIQIEPARRPLL